MATSSPQTEIAAILGDLNGKLRTTLATLKSDGLSSYLHQELHNGDRLPDKAIAKLAAESVDLAAEVESLLEPATLVLADHFFGYTNTKCLVAAVEIGIADILHKSGPLKLADLAAASAAEPERLGQVMSTLYNNNIFYYDRAAATYGNNHVSELLRSDHWAQWHNWVELYGNEFYDMARGIPKAVLASNVSAAAGGRPRSAAQISFGTEMNMFEYFQAQGWVPRLHRTLGGGATAMAPGILADYPWAEVGNQTVIDIGGGGGALVELLLRHHPHMRGGIYDLPGVIAHVSDSFLPGGKYQDLAARVPQGNLIAGNFLKWVPPSEVYTIKWTLHDWVDADVLKILRNTREAIKEGPGSRLVVLESITRDGRTGRLARYGDINMMMTINGRERTEAQWRELATEAGWEVAGVYGLRNAWVCAIDLRPA